MASSIQMIDPAQNEFLASLEAKSKKPSAFFRTMAQRPEALKTFVPFYGAVVGPGSVDRRIKELVYLTVSYTNHCAFCTAAHVASGRKAGITDGELKSLESATDGSFNATELAAIRFARELTKTADAQSSREELKSHFNDEQIVEITMVAAMANFTNRFNNALVNLPEA